MNIANFTNLNDPVFDHIEAELARQSNQIELIASENIVSEAVLRAQGSVLTNKYAEGYPSRRYYGGCEHVDAIERIAIERARALFGCKFANVQPHSGAQANAAVYLAMLQPGDVTLGMSLAHGGHLTHGSPVAMSGKWFEAHHYSVTAKTQLIDMDALAIQAREIRPKLIIAGGSAYPRHIDFAHFRTIADEVHALLIVDMAHIAGLVAGGAHPSPFPHAHIVTCTTHKTLRGPRGGMILTNDETYAKKINSAVFPGIQGGPLMHVIAAKAVAFAEAQSPAFSDYANQVVQNAQILAATLKQGGLNIVSDGTDTHMVLVDLRSCGRNGRDVEQALERVGLTCNKNGIPFDPEKPAITSGIRLGTPAGTSRGFKEQEFEQIGRLILKTIAGMTTEEQGKDAQQIAQIRKEVSQLCAVFPIYETLFQGDKNNG